MENTLLTLLQTIFSEAFAFSFLLGLVLFFVGFALTSLFILTRVLGKRLPGKVIGAVMETRVKTKTVDGKEKQKIKKTLYPVFEYQRPSGEMRQERASEGGSSTLKYTTGQSVNLIVRQDTDYDDVYDADNFGALWAGLIITVIGGAIMVQVASLSSAIGMGLISIISLITFKVITAIFDKNKKSHTPSDKGEKTAYNKHFKPDDLKPIEAFAKNK